MSTQKQQSLNPKSGLLWEADFQRNVVAQERLGYPRGGEGLRSRTQAHPLWMSGAGGQAAPQSLSHVVPSLPRVSCGGGGHLSPSVGLPAVSGCPVSAQISLPPWGPGEQNCLRSPRVSHMVSPLWGIHFSGNWGICAACIPNGVGSPLHRLPRVGEGPAERVEVEQL